MKITKILSSILLILIYNSTFCQEEWKTYEYPEHHFKAAFFQEPILVLDTLKFQESEVITYSYDVIVKDKEHDNSYYFVTSTTYPSDYIHSDSTWEIIDGFINSTQSSSLEDEMLEIDNVIIIEHHGYKGKQFKWRDKNEEFRFRSRVYLINNTVFEVCVIIKKGLDNNKGIAQFFDSFEIIDLPKGKYTEEAPKIEKKYEIQFPEKPEETIRNLESENGILTLLMESVQPEGKSFNLMFMASQTIYPEPIVDEKDSIALNEFYKNSMEGSLKGTDSKMINSKNIYYKGKLGKEFKGLFREGLAVLHYRLFLIDGVLYTQGGMTLPLFQDNPELIKFLDSFKIKE